MAKLSLEHNLPVCSLGYVYFARIPTVPERTFLVWCWFSIGALTNVSSFSERNRNLTIVFQYIVSNLYHLVEHFFLTVDFFFVQKLKIVEDLVGIFF